jgi:urease accessory protein
VHDSQAPSALGQSGWQAQLALRFEQHAHRTELVHRRHLGPLRVQRPFYPEPTGICHVYVLHPPGGVVGGDGLELGIDVGSGAHAVLTTPAATKLYRSGGAPAIIQQTLRVARDGCLEWLPQETIAFSAAQAELTTRIELDAGARFLGWEILCLGRPAASERFEAGHLQQRIELAREGKLRYCERGSYRGGSPLLRAAWGLRDQPVVGSLVCAGADLAAHLPELRAALGEQASPAYAAISCMGELCVARYLGPSTEQARECFKRVWQAVRPLVFDQPAYLPRIWAT